MQHKKKPAWFCSYIMILSVNQILEQACSTSSVWVTIKFGMLMGNTKFNTQNEE